MLKRLMRATAPMDVSRLAQKVMRYLKLVLREI
jgi:hypothetical protein